MTKSDDPTPRIAALADRWHTRADECWNESPVRAAILRCVDDLEAVIAATPRVCYCGDYDGPTLCSVCKPQEQPRRASAEWAVESIQRVIAEFGDNPTACAPMIGEVLQYYAEDKPQEQPRRLKAKEKAALRSFVDDILAPGELEGHLATFRAMLAEAESADNQPC